VVAGHLARYVLPERPLFIARLPRGLVACRAARLTTSNVRNRHGQKPARSTRSRGPRPYQKWTGWA
jgi:hypothetical protein